jgi:hypothetical protein
MRRKRAIFCLIVAAILGSHSWLPAVALSLQGQQLDAAIKEDFFTFFHMKERAIDERDDLATHYFRPGSRGDVVVCVDTDKSGKILQMSLVVGREFIDDPKTNVFARDLVKSFIEVATPPGQTKETSDLVNEIFFRGSELTPTKVEKVNYNGKEVPMGTDGSLVKVGKGAPQKGDVAIMMNGQIPKLPAKESEAYKAFLGTVVNSDTPITGAHVILKNHTFEKGKLLEVRVDVNTVKKTPKFEVVGEEQGDGADGKADQGKDAGTKPDAANADSGKPAPSSDSSSKGDSGSSENKTESK